MILQDFGFFKEVAKDFANKFEDITNKGYDYFEGLAEHTANRVRELGKVTGYEKAGIMKYEIRAIMDDRTSDICQAMNGKIFEVAAAVDFRDTILSLDNPEDIKNAAPWRSGSEIKGIPDNEMPVGMELPPYHWRCRTLTVAYFEEDLQTSYPPLTDEERSNSVETLNKNENYKESKKVMNKRLGKMPEKDKINPDDTGMIHYYSKSKFQKINRFYDNFNRYLDNPLKQINDNIKLHYESARNILNEALTNLNTLYSGEVFRKVKMYALNKYVVGDVITENRFISSSWDKKITEGREGEVLG